MADDLRTLAFDLKDYLVKYHRVSNVLGPDPLSPDWRTWEIRFTHRGLQRHFVYRVERQDPISTMYQALRANTTGELLVRVPNLEASGLLTNPVYYPPHG